MAVHVARAEVWLADLDPVRGHEQGRRRPVLVVSNDTFNQGPATLLIIVPLTRTDRGIPTHIPVDPPEGGVRERSFIMCEAIRSISKDRLTGSAWGIVRPHTMALVEDRLGILLDL